MAIGIYFAPTTMTQQQYFECIKRLKKAGRRPPAGSCLPRVLRDRRAHPGLRRLDLAGGVRKIRANLDADPAGHRHRLRASRSS